MRDLVNSEIIYYITSRMLLFTTQVAPVDEDP
jgi:hypothetical protein